jgi:hypothetical protein
MQNPFKVSDCSFVTGAPVTAHKGWLAVTEDALTDMEHTLMVWFNPENAGWEFGLVWHRFFTTRSVVWLPAGEEAIFVGDNGECCAVRLRDDAQREEQVTSGERNPRTVGNIRSAARWGDEVIAVGMQRQAYRRSADGVWSDMMQGFPDPAQGGVSGLECVLALSGDEVYAAGWHGEIWRFDGHLWQPVPSPTRQLITAMCLDPSSGQVLAAGRGGLLLRGRHGQWDLVPGGGCPADIWSMSGATGTVYAAGLGHLFALEDGVVEPLDVDATSFGELVEAGSGALWSLGRKDFLGRDDTGWRRIV